MRRYYHHCLVFSAALHVGCATYLCPRFDNLWGEPDDLCEPIVALSRDEILRGSPQGNWNALERLCHEHEFNGVFCKRSCCEKIVQAYSSGGDNVDR